MTADTQLLGKQCMQCRTGEGTLSTCGGCKVVQYCSKEHQAGDWPAHKTQCSAVKKARAKVENEERKLRDDEPRVFEDFTGHFWGRFETRPYMRARHLLIEALRKIKTRLAVQAALDCAMECMHLCHSDNMGVRFMIPSMMIRLGQDQEAYDFMKWYGTTGQDDHYDWGDMSLPFLNLRNENIFEDISAGQWDNQFVDLSHLCAITLIKVRVLFDLHTLQSSRVVGEKVPQEILDAIQGHLVSNAVGSNQEIVRDVQNGKDLKRHITNMEQQTNKLLTLVTKRNEHFWPTIVNPEDVLDARPESYSHGSKSEVIIMLQYSYEAWEETPDAIDRVREKLRG